jgi:octaprenyl-diphosphate synthase
MTTPFALIHEDLKQVESEILKSISSDVSLIPEIGKHIFFSGGKRFRPALLILCCRLFRPGDTRCITLAGSIELIHTATLLHDDVVDRADIRRGKRSVNVVWGNEASILVGDFLFSQAVLVGIRTGTIRFLEILTDATKSMSEGEIFGLSLGRSLDINEAQYMRLITKKTATLISAACRIGAVLGGAVPHEEEQLAKFGEDLGTAFQLVDDVLDYVSRPDRIGKPVGGDLDEQKATLPLIHVLGKLGQAQKGVVDRRFHKEKKDEQDFQYFLKLITDEGGIAYTLDKAGQFIRNAKGRLDGFPDSAEKRALMELADYVITRNA